MSNEHAACLDEIAFEVLTDYWLAALNDPEEEVVEEHLLACARCSERLGDVIALSESVRKLAREGSLRMIVSNEFLKRAQDDGLRIREYAVPAGGGVNCTVTTEDDILIGRLGVDINEAAQVDLSLCDESGAEQIRLTDIPFDVEAGDVAYQESMTFARVMPTGKIIARLLAVDESSDERLLGEFIFNHTQSLDRR